MNTQSTIFHNAESKLLIQLAKNAELQKQVDILSSSLDRERRRNAELESEFYSFQKCVYDRISSYP